MNTNLDNANTRVIFYDFRFHRFFDHEMARHCRGLFSTPNGDMIIVSETERTHEDLIIIRIDQSGSMGRFAGRLFTTLIPSSRGVSVDERMNAALRSARNGKLLIPQANELGYHASKNGTSTYTITSHGHVIAEKIESKKKAMDIIIEKLLQLYP